MRAGASPAPNYLRNRLPTVEEHSTILTLYAPSGSVCASHAACRVSTVLFVLKRRVLIEERRGGKRKAANETGLNRRTNPVFPNLTFDFGTSAGIDSHQHRQFPRPAVLLRCEA